MIKNKLLNYIFISLIIFGIFLRFYNLRYNIQFNWDQENLLAIPARDIILKHKLTLIGARTSVGNLYIGPLYSYLAAAVFYVFHMDPIAAAILSALISSFTIIISYILINHISNTRVGLIYCSLWLLSPFTLFFDRIPWNMNLLPLSSILLSCGLWIIQKENRMRGWVLTGLGIYLAINSHFSAVFLISIAVIFFIINKKIINKYIYIPLVFLLLGLAPLFLFNLRHANMLGANLLAFSRTSIASHLPLHSRALHSLGLIMETMGRVLKIDGSTNLQKGIAVVFCCSLIYLRKDKNIKKYISIFIIYLVVYILGFTLDSGPIPKYFYVPDYYYLGILPIVAIGMSIIVYKITSKYAIFWLLVFATLVIAAYTDYKHVSRYDPYSLGVKQQVIQFIKKDAGDKVVDINYDMEMGWSVGYDYLLDYYNVHRLKKADHDKTYWISYPKGIFPGKPDYVVGDIAVGLPKTSQKIYSH